MHFCQFSECLSSIPNILHFLLHPLRAPHRRPGHGERAHEVSLAPTGALLVSHPCASSGHPPSFNPFPCITSSPPSSSPTPTSPLQAYFFRAKLPITDYINDTKTVLDQAPRVLNALLDVAVEMGLLDVALALTMLSKMIVQVTSFLSPPFSLTSPLPFPFGTRLSCVLTALRLIAS
jgi:Sec63 Brl domain